MRLITYASAHMASRTSAAAAKHQLRARHRADCGGLTLGEAGNGAEMPAREASAFGKGGPRAMLVASGEARQERARAWR